MYVRKHLYCVVFTALAKPDIHRGNTAELQILIEMQKSLMLWKRTHVKLFLTTKIKTQSYLKALMAPTTTCQGRSVCSYFGCSLNLAQNAHFAVK